MDGKVILVTGGSSGIGEATARLFAAEGASVVLSARGAEKGEAVAADIRGSGGAVEFVQADVCELDDVKRLTAEILNRFGRLDYAFNNAGTVGE